MWTVILFASIYLWISGCFPWRKLPNYRKKKALLKFVSFQLDYRGIIFPQWWIMMRVWKFGVHFLLLLFWCLKLLLWPWRITTMFAFVVPFPILLKPRYKILSLDIQNFEGKTVNIHVSVHCSKITLEFFFNQRN